VSSRPDTHLSILPPVRTTCHTVRTPDRLKYHPPGRRGFPSGPFSVSRSFCYSFHPSGRLSNPSGRLSVVDQASNSFQNQIWENFCNRPDALLLKASSQFKFNRPDASLPWSGCAFNRYGNCVLKINRPDARSLNKEITCSGRAIVRKTIPHRPDAALKKERFSAKILEFRLHSCLSGGPMSTVRMAPVFIKAVAHLNPQPINRGPWA
jgi:hypothetical protein